MLNDVKSAWNVMVTCASFTYILIYINDYIARDIQT